MAEPVDFAELEARLVALGRHVAYPPTPALAATLRRRVQAGEARPAWRTRLRGSARGTGDSARGRRLVIAMAVLAALLLGALAAPPVRDGIAHFFHVPGVDIQSGPHALRSSSPGATASANTLGLGTATTLAAARAGAGFPVRVPQSLGAPDEVYVEDGQYGTAVTLVYRPRPGLPAVKPSGVGLLLTEVRGSIDHAFIGKMVPQGSQVAEVSVAGHPGYWITGAPHEVLISTGQDIHQEALRLAGDTLVWSDGGEVWRVESGLSEDAVLAIARSLR